MSWYPWVDPPEPPSPEAYCPCGAPLYPGADNLCAQCVAQADEQEQAESPTDRGRAAAARRYLVREYGVSRALLDGMRATDRDDGTVVLDGVVLVHREDVLAELVRGLGGVEEDAAVSGALEDAINGGRAL